LSLFTRFGRPATQNETTAKGDLTTAEPAAATPDAAAAADTAGADTAVGDTAESDTADTDTTEADAVGDESIRDESVGDDVGDRGEDAVGEDRKRKHPIAGPVTTVLAGLLMFLALTGPGDISHRTLRVFLRMPVEGLIGIAILLVLPPKARRWAAGFGGLVLGLLAIEKVVDIGFYTVLGRPFDLVLDWILLGDAVGVLKDSVGQVGAIGTVLGAVLLLAAGLILMMLSAVRLTSVAAQHRPIAIRVIAGLGCVWVACAAFGVQFVPGVPVADRSTSALVQGSALQVRAGLRDKSAFTAEAAVDPFRDVPGNQLLTGLRGKDVVISFVESYGRSALQDPTYATEVNPLLDAGTRRLAAAGYSSRSAFLTSSTAGGGSWLAHASLLSGLWINNQQRYRTLVSSNRLTLTSAFRRAGWRTVSVEPAISDAWPEGKFFGYDKDYDSRNLGYNGPRFSYATMPDQYTFAAFQRAERAAPNHAPLMAEITLLSSHTPWTPVPRLMDWNDLGDGSVFNSPSAEVGDPPTVVWKNRGRIRAAYLQSIEYTLSALISYVEKYGDENLVFVFLGDHQPFSVIAGTSGNRDVPITIVARDRAVLNRISGWGWQDGLRPSPQAPVWRMDTFRNRFLTAFAQ
jgi:hypothetical protein